ncbi:Protein of unknown function [Monaibacterium marinum]|uniref:DUF3072 domain-containing protein n=1 Tax=Pontivivens marinum TaxID=1690039 RepID=A0A2C9CMX3_9RHOB|nr:DUF3072 domain-containing protein [Monaibacterium marinum]SOH92572.1 Protein of unknown function [Monaibacterium marinum]
MTDDTRTETARRQAQINAKTPGIYAAGGQAMTAAQADTLQNLCEMAGESFDGSLSQADAAIRIAQLQREMNG